MINKITSFASAAISLLSFGQPLQLGTFAIMTTTLALHQGSVIAQDVNDMQRASANEYLVQAEAILTERGREREVIRLASQALAIQPSAEGYGYSAYAKGQLKDYQGSIADLGQALKINPQYEFAHQYLGLLNYRMGNFKESIIHFNNAIEINSQDVSSLGGRGLSKGSLGDFQGAVDDLSKAIEIDPYNGDLYFNRGKFHGQLGKHVFACVDFKEAISLGDNSAQQVLNLTPIGDLCRQLGY